MIKIFIPIHNFGAGKWIYEGYFKAWQNIGFEPVWYDPKDLKDLPTNSHIMAVDSQINDTRALKQFEKVYLFCLPFSMPKHWGKHPNFVTSQKIESINNINELKNVIKWSFAKYPQEFANPWNNIQYVPLAFDNLSYQNLHTEYKYDVCFIGGWANNGFNEKESRIKEILGSFKDSKLRCGFFINKNLSHEQENKVLSNTLLPLNIHDQYQVELGWDTNERTFKSLGLSGSLISDHVQIFEDDSMKDLKIVESADPLKHFILFAYSMIIGHNILKKEIELYKKKNIDAVLKNHTYVSRVKQMLELKND